MTLEELREENIKLKENNELLSQDNEQLKNSLEESQNRIKELEGYNQKLFMRVTSKVDEVEEEETYEPKLISKEQYDLLSEQEKEELKELESEVI